MHNQHNRPESIIKGLRNPKHIEVYFIDLSIWIARFKNPRLLLAISILLNPPSQTAQMSPCQVFSCPEVDRA